MDIYQRYNLQKQAVLKSIGYKTANNKISSALSADNEIDNYILTMIETNDNRRLLLDKADYNNILDAIGKDAERTIEKAIDNLCQEIK